MRTSFRRVTLLITLVMAAVLLAGSWAAADQPPPDQAARLARVTSTLDRIEQRLDRLDRRVADARGVDAAPPRLLERSMRWILGALDTADMPLHGLRWNAVEAPIRRILALRQRARALQERLASWPSPAPGDNGDLPVVTDAGLGTGSISGTVTDAVTGNPIPFTRVRVYCPSGSYFDGETISDGAGHYVMSGLDAGTCYVRTENQSGYLNELWDDIPCPRGCWMTDGTPVTVTDGTETPGIDFALDLAGGIRGSVTDASTGDPVSQDATAYLWDADGNYYGVSDVDPQGTYRFQTLPPGTYYVGIYSPTYLDQVYDGMPCNGWCDPTSGAPVTVTQGSVTYGIDFALQLGGSISGRVTDDATHNPIANADVILYDASGGYVDHESTAVDGSFRVADLETGTYFLRISHWDYIPELYDDVECDRCLPTSGTPIQVTAGQETANIDTALGHGSTLSGTVTDASTGAALPETDALLYDSLGNYQGDDRTNGAGEYSFSMMYSGTYHVIVREASHIDELYDDIPCEGSCDPVTGTPVTVPAKSAVSGIDFGLDLGGVIKGTVLDQATGQRAEGVPVEIYDTTGTRVASVTTDAQGTYRVQDLPAGTYYALCPRTSRYLGQLYDGLPCADGCDPTGGTDINVSLGAISGGINFSLTGGYITGRITDAASGAPVPYARVHFYDAAGNEVCSVSSRDDGTYRSCALDDGDHFVLATSTDYVDQLYDGLACDGGCDPTTGTAVPVTVGTVASGIDFAMTPYGEISGTLADAASGTPLVDVEVNIYNADGTRVKSVRSNNAGVYTSGHLPAGTYFVVAAQFDRSYAGKLYDGFPCEGSCDPTTGTPVTVSDGAVTGSIDFALQRFGTISGSVVDAATGGPPAGGVEILIYNASGWVVGEGSTDPSGHYIAPVQASGQVYVVTGHGDNNRYIAQLYDGVPCDEGCDVTTGTPVTVAAGTNVIGIDFTLTRHGAIAGHVVEASTGNPPAEYSVRLNIYQVDGSMVKQVTPDSQGRFITGGLRAGTYYVATAPNGPDRYVDELYDGIVCDGGCDPTTGTPITVTDGALTDNIDFSLARYGAIRGQIVDSVTGGNPDRGYLHVVIYDDSGNQVASSQVSQDGQYVTRPLPPGTYFVLAGDGSGYDHYIDQLYQGIPCNDGCSPVQGTPVTVSLEATTEHIDFSLDPVPTFADVPLTFWAFQQVETIYAHGIMDACDSSLPLFCPRTPITRAEMAHALLVAIEGPYYSPPPAVGLFDDVPPDDPDAPWIEDLAARGITTGCNDAHTLYCPDDPVTRAQMAAFLLRTLEGPVYTSPPCTGIFLDVPCPGFWGADYVEDLFARGITTGCNDDHTLYCPRSPVTRAQMATFLTRTFPIH